MQQQGSVSVSVIVKNEKEELMREDTENHRAFTFAETASNRQNRILLPRSS